MNAREKYRIRLAVEELVQQILLPRMETPAVHLLIEHAAQEGTTAVTALYGGEAFERVIDCIRTKPFGDSPRVALTCHKDNAVALGLYEKKGFAPTGAVYDDEIELALTVG